MNTSPLLLVVLISSIVIMPTVNLLIANDTVVLNISADDDIVVFIDALYPNGFKNIGRIHVISRGALQLNVDDVRSAWSKALRQRGVYAPLTLRLVAYNKNGLVGARIVRIDFNELKYNKLLNIYFTSKDKTILQTKTVSLNSIEPLISSTRVLEDYYEWNKTVVLAMLNLDLTTYGTLHYAYLAYGEIGFTMYLIYPDIEFAGWIAYSRNTGIGLQTAASLGGKAYVWMTFKYRWEKWRVYGPGLPPDGYIEEYVYIADFYPETAGAGTTRPADSVLTSIDSWNTSIYKAPNTTYLPYFQATYGTLGSRYSAIDLTAFVNQLFRMGKITASTRSLITMRASSIGVDSCINHVLSYAVAVDLYSKMPSSYYEVRIGRNNLQVNGLNSLLVYYVVTLKH